MIRTEDIHSLTDFRQNAKAHLDRLAASGGVEVLTVNGQAKGVVMSPQTFDDLYERARQAEITAKIQRGLAEIETGRGLTSDEAMKTIAKDRDNTPAR